MNHTPAVLFAALAAVLSASAFAETAPKVAVVSTPEKVTAPTPPPEPSPEAIAELKKRIVFNSVYVEEPYVAITFDDGPHGANTPRLLKMLADRKIKATFFFVGECVDQHPEIVKRIAEAGHELGNHSWSHPNLIPMSEDGVRSQLQRTHNAVVNACGKPPTVMRPPYGNLTQKQRQWVHDEFGYKIIMWDVDPLDWKRPGAGVVAQRIVTNTSKGSIILAHDIHAGTIDAVPAILDGLTAKGFKFATVSELIAMAKPKPPSAPKKAEPEPAMSAKDIEQYQQGGKTAPTEGVPAEAPAKVGTPQRKAVPVAPVSGAPKR